MWFALHKIAVLSASLLVEINLLRHQVSDQLIWGDLLSANPKSNTEIYSSTCSFCVGRNVFKLLLISPCLLLLYQHPQWETLPLFLIAALLKWLFFCYFFLNHQRKECCMLFSLPDTASWQRTLKLCHERKLSKTLLWFSLASLCCFYWGTFRKAKIFFFYLLQGIKIFG